MKLYKRSGFTLIELLVVIAVLGILASVILIAINPTEQLARGRDAGRKTTVGQIGNAAQAFFTVRGGTYPTVAAYWTEMIASQELKQDWADITATGYTACATNMHNGMCYNLNAGATEAIVFARMESLAENSRCVAATPVAYFVWSSFVGRGGRYCGTVAAPPAAGVALTLTD